MESTNKNVGRIVKKWLRDRHISQQAAAEYLGMKQGSLSKMLNGFSPLPRERLKAIIAWISPPRIEIEEVQRALAPPPLAPPISTLATTQQRLDAIVDERPPDMSEEEFRHWQTLQEMTGDWQQELKQAEYEMRQVIMAYLDQMELRQLTGVRDFVRKLTMEGKK